VSTRITDAGAIEHRLLELAHTTDAKITAPALAYFAPCSLDDATRVLDDLAARDRLGMEIEDDGTIVYQMAGRQKIAVPPGYTGPVPLRPIVASRALIPTHREVGPSPIAAAALSALVPGAGHLYAGRFAAAVLWFVVVGIGYALILPGLVLHLFSIASAAVAANRESAAARLSLAQYATR
jgi:hypothetical protein